MGGLTNIYFIFFLFNAVASLDYLSSIEGKVRPRGGGQGQFDYYFFASGDRRGQNKFEQNSRAL